jgi:Icc-related predicted phosphoesterase
LQNEKTIVVTHHVPTLMNFPMEFKGDVFSAYATELSEMIEELKPNAWIYGHSHHSKPKFQIGETILLNNALGYVRSEKTKYKNGRLIQL